MPTSRHQRDTTGGKEPPTRPRLTCFCSVLLFALFLLLQDVAPNPAHNQQTTRVTRQKTSHDALSRQQRFDKPQPQTRSESSGGNDKPQPERPSMTSTTNAPPTSPTRDELLTGFFHNAPEAGLSYTLCILPAPADRTCGEWELYEDHDPAKRSCAHSPRGAQPPTRRRTTWSGRWSLQPERDGFGWVELIKTAEVVQENGRKDEQQCLMTQRCPYNLTTDGEGRTVMGIMLNAFDRAGGLFLTRAL